jgi:hypothetical protein
MSCILEESYPVLLVVQVHCCLQVNKEFVCVNCQPDLLLLILLPKIELSQERGLCILSRDKGLELAMTTETRKGKNERGRRKTP